MFNKDENVKELNEMLEEDQLMNVKLQVRLNNEIICRSQVSKSLLVSKVMKSKGKSIMSYSKQIKLDYERTKQEKDASMKKVNS